jgi:hypothetical protein
MLPMPGPVQLQIETEMIAQRMMMAIFDMVVVDIAISFCFHILLFEGKIPSNLNISQKNIFVNRIGDFFKSF